MEGGWATIVSMLPTADIQYIRRRGKSNVVLKVGIKGDEKSSDGEHKDGGGEAVSLGGGRRR